MHSNNKPGDIAALGESPRQSNELFNPEAMNPQSEGLLTDGLVRQGVRPGRSAMPSQHPNGQGKQRAVPGVPQPIQVKSCVAGPLAVGVLELSAEAHTPAVRDQAEDR